MDNSDSKKDSNKKKGFLSGSFSKAARKIVLGGVLVTGLMAGVSGTAMAQSYNGGNNGMAQSSVQEQPWSGDRTYQIKLNNLEEQSAMRVEQLRAYEQNRQAQLNQWHTQAITNQIQYATNARGGKWNFSRMANVGAQGAAVEARYRQGMVDISTDYRSRTLQEQERLMNQVDALDNYYSRLPQYRGATYNTNGYRQAAPAAPSGSQALSPQQQHDRLVRAYQDAQLRSAEQGRPMPKPQSFGLSPNDPSIGGR